VQKHTCNLHIFTFVHTYDLSKQALVEISPLKRITPSHHPSIHTHHYPPFSIYIFGFPLLFNLG